MKALVLCGVIPQIALTQYLKSKGITVVMADMNENVVGREYADIFYPVSVLDVEAVKNVAIKEKVDFVITVCADQVLEVAAQVSEMLSLPCYIDAQTATNVSKKSFMKEKFIKCGVPTTQYVILEELDFDKIKHLQFPLVVKPIDSYSSRGVKKVLNEEELKEAFKVAKQISRASTVIVEEFAEGEEVSVDFYVENGVAKYLTSSNSDKIKGEGFIIHRTRNPALISEEIKSQILEIGQKIADGFGLKDSPMLVQLITDGKRISVVEFCARTGGSIKFRLIKRITGFDVVKAVADLTMGNKPHYEPSDQNPGYLINEFIYCEKGIIHHLEGFEDLLNEGIISEYHQFKINGSEVLGIRNSGDRVASFTIQTDDLEVLKRNHAIANKRIKVVNSEGKDIIRHDLISNLCEKEI